MNIPGYKIERELGHGGMSTVYLAEHESLHKKVALKVMEPALAADRSFGERFLREAQTVAQLTHQNILAVYDMGSIEHSYYLVMEYVPGGDLKQRIQQGALPPEQALAILKQVASALGYAHKKGFVHRDVKPENVLFREDGTAVLADFGIAKALGSGTRMTAVGMSIGTPHYMSPEQARGKEVDGRADLYSLGVVLYEMLTGRVPFDAEDTYAVGLMHISEPAPDLPGNLAALQPLLDRLMAKDPAQRFVDAGELIASIDQLQSGQSIQRPVSATRIIPQVAQPVQTSKVAMGSGPKLAVGGVLLALLLFGGLWLARQKTSAFPANDLATASTSGAVAQTETQSAGSEFSGGTGRESSQQRNEGTRQGQSNQLLIDPVTGMEFVRVPGGCFQMGDTFGDGESDEKPLHEVCVDGFWMGKTEVTQGQWQKVMGSNPSRFKYGSNYPVEEVSWNDAQNYIRSFAERSGKPVRLPTEAEWEYAARSGGKNEKYAGGGYLDDVVWYKDNSGGSTHMVASKQPNGLGLYDMSGNVWEWCQDLYNKDYYRVSPRNNPSGPTSGYSRVNRGGSWLSLANHCRVPDRSRDGPGYREYGLGLRLVMTSDR